MNWKRDSIVFVCVLLVGILTDCSKKKLYEDTLENAISSEPEAVVPAPQVEKEVEKQEFEVSYPFQIYFDFDKWTLREGSMVELDKIYKEMIDKPNSKLLIEGHTCRIGSFEYNMALGQHRGLAAKLYLSNRGIDEDRISVVSMGEMEPQGPTLADDRRDEFTFTILE